VPVIAEVDHAREARSGEARVAPEAVRPLRAREVLDAAPHGVRSRLSRGDQREHRPGTLVRGARRARPGAPGLVAVVALAPAAVRILPALEPAHRALDRGVIGADTGLRKRGQHGPRAIDVVRAPAAEPRAVRLLLSAQVVDRARERRTVLGPAHPRES